MPASRQGGAGDDAVDADAAALTAVYHEAQEPGSQLCAQHCLNNLLQGPYFAAGDLGELSRQLDERERALLEGNALQRAVADGSMNGDDTGFFSVQVVNAALAAFDVEAERVTGAAPATDRYCAFVVNQDLHWFCIRCFGAARNGGGDGGSPRRHGHGHGRGRRWVKLDSHRKRGPELLTETHVGLLLHQLREEGYDVFGIANGAPLPECAADQCAALHGSDDGSDAELHRAIALSALER